MACNSSSLENYLCSDRGVHLPLINEYTWPKEVRAFLYMMGLLYCFLGVAIIDDIFMCSIEKITSKTRRIVLSNSDENQPEIMEVKVWNDTVASFTIMALGSSAPEILLTIIEIIRNKYKAGDLGTGTIVGSAAFNLFVICAICIISLPSGEYRRIRMINVFLISAVFCIFAFFWLLIVLIAITPGIVEIWEAATILLFFPILVILCYYADRNFIKEQKLLKESQIDLESSTDMLHQGYFPDGQMNKDNLISFIREIRKHSQLSEADVACLATSRLLDEKEHSRMWYRIEAVRKIIGGKKPKPTLNNKLKEVYDSVLIDEEKQLQTELNSETVDVAIVEFAAASCAVLESAGQLDITILRHGKTTNKISCKLETIDGTAKSGEDYIEKKEVVVFEANETEKNIFIEIVNDNQCEPDETFFLKLGLCENEVEEVVLGRTSIMEITILNDDKPGIVEFKKRGMFIKENIGVAHIPVVRKYGADGIISCKWRTIDKSAINGKDFIGGKGKLVFENAVTEKHIEIPIIDDFDVEKDEQFEIELFKPRGTGIGKINRTVITIINDDDFNSIIGKIMLMINVNMDSLRLHSEHWIDQIKDAMNVNGGDLQNATPIDYILHFITFGWKVVFALVPPSSIFGGWLTFFICLIALAVLIIIIIDIASIFGCLVGLRDSVTGITFIALGTSIPDLFASKAAAIQEKYADSAIINVTGNNSVNVFLGIGLSWLIASIYWNSKGMVFEVEAETLKFSIKIYSIAAFICIVLLMMRRHIKNCGGGELGGSKILARLSASLLINLWILFIILTSLEAYGYFS